MIKNLLIISIVLVVGGGAVGAMLGKASLADIVIGAFLTPIYLAALLLPMLIAIKKGRSGVRWFFYTFFLYPVALIHAALMRPIRKCPHCAENIDTRAKICPFCGKTVIATKKHKPQN